MAKTKDLTFIALMVALLIAVQFVLYALPGVELVSVLLGTYAAANGRLRGVAVAVCYALLRNIVFGFYPDIVILYLIYFPLFALAMGSIKSKFYVFHVIVAVTATAFFSVLDAFIKQFFYGVKFLPYFYGSLPFMIPQMITVTITYILLFPPLKILFDYLKKNMLK